MGPVLEEAAILLQQTDKVFPPVGIKPGGEDQGVGAFDGVDRVDLYEPHLPDLVLDGPATAPAALDPRASPGRQETAGLRRQLKSWAQGCAVAFRGS